MPPRWLAVVIFFGTLVLIGVAQLYWYRRARSLVGRARPGWPRWALGLLLFSPLCLVWFVYVAGTGALLLSFFTNPGAPRGLIVFLHTLRHSVVMIPVGLWSAASGFSFLFIKLVEATGWLAARVYARGASRRAGRPATPNPVNPDRRYFLQTATSLAGAVPFAVVGYGFFRRQRYTVEAVSVPILNLPPALDGLRLVQLTDVHASAYMPVSEIDRVVAMASELDADLVFHTGDFITSRGDPLDTAIDTLARVRGRYGLFGCLGNHEIYAVAETRATRRFTRHGCKILRGEAQVIEIRGARLNLIGVDYQRQPRGPARKRGAGRDPSRALGASPEDYRDYFLRGIEPLVRRDMPNILLTHNPNPFRRAAELGIELTLAGHTHGGQVQVEILDSRLSPARFITRFISGLYSLPSGQAALAAEAVSTGHRPRVTGHCFLYVSRGIGTIGMPVRLGAPPEITLLTLSRA
ncbi:MAG: metallophosphoesterase [Terriglobia bacterium]